MLKDQLISQATDNINEATALAQQGDVHGSMAAYEEALRDLHSVGPSNDRDVLLAQVYLARYENASKFKLSPDVSDLRSGYSYAKTTKDVKARALAETLWQAYKE